jgi:GDP-mannose 6-dehydrogenase
MKIGVFGLGYVGLTTAVCLAKDGHEVVGIDINEQKVNDVNCGRSPIGEPGLEGLLSVAIARGALKCSTRAIDGVKACDMAIVCVGTPSLSDGSHNMSFIAEVSRQIATAIEPRHLQQLTVVYRSTVRPGTIDKLIRPIFDSTLKNWTRAIELVYNPEFLRESTAVEDFFNPPRIVMGTENGAPSERMDQLYAKLVAPRFYTGYREAEFTKFADNTFHALKVTYANELGRICRYLDVDMKEMHKIFVADTKLNISANYLRPGGAFGGSCLPKDVRALQHIANEVGANSHVIDAIIRSNESHKTYLFQLCTRNLKAGAKVLLVGLAFKANSDDLRESPNVNLARRLILGGFKLSVYDPCIDVDHLMGQNLGYVYSHLPPISELLVSRELAESVHYDLVIDTNGLCRMLNLASTNVVDVGTLR